MTKDSTEEILQLRGLRNCIPGPHGEWGDNAATGQELKSVARKALDKRAKDGVYPQMGAIHLEAVDMIFLKIARILTGDANETDHWQDIEGYARLCRERLGPTMAQTRAVAPAHAVAPSVGAAGAGGTSAHATDDASPVALPVAGLPIGALRPGAVNYVEAIDADLLTYQKGEDALSAELEETMEKTLSAPLLGDNDGPYRDANILGGDGYGGR